MTSQSAINRRGMLAMTGATAGFAINDAMMKLLVADLPVSQIMVLRGLIVAALALVWLAREGRLSSLSDITRGTVLVRAALEAAVVLVYMQALRAIPLGLATAILQATPLMITAAAAIWGRETVGFARWAAVVVGFAGVLLIVQPDAHGISPAMLLAVITAIFVGARDLSNRAVPAHVPLFLIVFAASLANVLGGGAMAFAESTPWLWPTLHQSALILGAASFVLASTALITFSFRGTEVSAVSPFRYVGVPVALLIGLVVWGDAPNFWAGVGIALVVAAGIFAMRDEAMRAKSR
ncbi:MAG: EamA-like transporter family protein [Hyphomicrobiales bacterium]|nr:EamA-like transporter family protein [Hyphomicrobiales bacterium]